MRISHFVLAGLLIVSLSGVASADTILASELPEGTEIHTVMLAIGEVNLAWFDGSWHLVELDLEDLGEFFEEPGETPPFEGGPLALSSETPGGETPLLALSTEESTRVPEPATVLLLGMGIGGLFLARRRAV